MSDSSLRVTAEREDAFLLSQRKICPSGTKFDLVKLGDFRGITDAERVAVHTVYYFISSEKKEKERR